MDRDRPAAAGIGLLGAAGVGLFAGTLAGLFGVGGGILLVPGLVLLLGMDQRRAHGTSLAAIVPIAASGVAAYAFEGAVDWPAAALLTLGAGAGAVVGTGALQRLGQRTLRRAFAGFMLAAAVALILHLSGPTGRAPLDPVGAAGLIGIGVVSGILASLLGVGGGIVMVPALVLLFAVPDAVAKGTSLAVIIPTAVVGTARNVRHGSTDLPAAAVAGLAGVASAYVASLIAVGLDPRVSAATFAGFLVAVAATLVLRRQEGS